MTPDETRSDLIRGSGESGGRMVPLAPTAGQQHPLEPLARGPGEPQRPQAELPAARTLVIESVRRTPEHGDVEELLFSPGVNLLVGPPNTGKSKWIRFIDFLLGDGNTPESTLGPELADKYRSASITVRIHDRPVPQAEPVDPAGNRIAAEGPAATDLTLLLERRWKEPGMKGKVFVNGDPVTTDDFSELLLTLLGMPVVHFPRGDPYAPRAWPVLSWRTLFRHIYREERFWSDLADRQPEGDQHASLMQFLGLAEQLFSVEYGQLVQMRKEAQQLRAQQESYMEMLQQITQELGRFGELSVAITSPSLNAAQARLVAERQAIVEQRTAILGELARAAVTDGPANRVQSAIEQYGEELAVTRTKLEMLRDESSRANLRIHELTQYRESVQQERKRMERAHAAGTALAELKVTDCPVCDRQVSQNRGGGHGCYLCLQPSALDGNDAAIGTRRIEFEVEQLAVEESELVEVLERHHANLRRVQEQLEETEGSVAAIEQLLEPTHTAIAAVLPPGLSLLDQRIGGLDEQMRTLGSVAKALERRDELATKIDAIEAEAEALDVQVSSRSKDAPFGSASLRLEEGLNTYFNDLNGVEPGRWPEGKVEVHLRKRDFAIELKRADWHGKLGATLTCFFLNAYHYALLSLSGLPGCNYPGLAIIDFPPTLADDRELTDEENYLVEPFLELLARLPVPTQLIVAGRAFVDLQGAHRIQLTDVYQ